MTDVQDSQNSTSPSPVPASPSQPTTEATAPAPAASVAASVPTTEAAASTAAPQEPTAAVGTADQPEKAAEPTSPAGLSDSQRLFLIIAEAELNLVSALGPFLDSLARANLLDNQARKAANDLKAAAHRLRTVLQPGVQLMKAAAHA